MGPEPLKERAERGSGDLLPPSPPAEKATAGQDQAGTRPLDNHRHFSDNRSGALTELY
jgi:hypothetical protein